MRELQQENLSCFLPEPGRLWSGGLAAASLSQGRAYLRTGTAEETWNPDRDTGPDHSD